MEQDERDNDQGQADPAAEQAAIERAMEDYRAHFGSGDA